MSWSRRRALAIFVCVAAATCFYSYYLSLNDQFDRLARARQIANFGAVPFRDFFDPGYFLTLYSSALVERLFGDNLFGEVLLNVSFMAVGTMLVFLLASRASRSLLWGLVAAGIVVVSEPRMYDYDKLLFYPLGVYACWRYIDRPSSRSLVFVSAVTVMAGLFRYDSAVYIGAGMTVAIVARHWGEWSMAARRFVAAAVTACILASPALIFIERTAGLKNAWDQITTYARREGLRSSIFTPSTFSLGKPEAANLNDDGSSFPVTAERWLERVASDKNAAAWLYYVAVGIPFVALLLPWRPTAGSPLTAAMVLSYSALAELVALFVLRDPISARLGGVMPLMTIGGGYLMGEWIAALRERWTVRPSWLTLGTLGAVGGLVCLLSIGSVCALIWFPPKSHLEFVRRWREYRQVPTNADFLPKGELTPLVRYVHDCTRPTDRVLATWFVGELYYFSGRGFAGGLPVVFGDHWSELRYQRRSIQFLERESVPLVLVSEREHGMNPASYPLLWNFIRSHYERKGEIRLVEETVQLWVERERPVERTWGATALPCFAPVS